MNKLSAFIGVSALVAGFCSTAQAGTYFGLDVGGGVNNNASNLLDIHGGYRFMNLLAVEVGYSKIGGVKPKSGLQEKDIGFTYVSGLAYLPLPAAFTAMLDIYGRAGLGYSSYSDSRMDYSFSEKKVNTFFGIGAEFNMIPFVSLRAEVQHIPELAGGGKPTLYKIGANIKF